MRETKWNDGWKFWPEKNVFALEWSVPEDAESVTLPHDAMLIHEAHSASKNGLNTGFRDGGDYIYSKMFYAPQSWKDQTIAVKFDGIYMNSFIYINGHLAKQMPYGYTTFLVWLDSWLNYGGDNELRVIVRNGAMSNSRWYSGSGIYRDVWFLEGGAAYIVPEKIRLTTEYADQKKAVVVAGLTIKNRMARTENFHIRITIYDPLGTEAIHGEFPVTLLEDEESEFNYRFAIKEPMLWDSDHPNMYTCTVRLVRKSDGADEDELDISMETFGVRTITVDAIDGFCVNKVPVKLRGACVHHDSGLLGGATFEQAQFRQIRMLKKAGFNAVRMAHHPMAPAMLRACDREGMYVMDEAFDMWSRSKTNYDYALFFEHCWEQDVEAMVRKDYNHPSVVMYSLGNEISEIGLTQGQKVCQMLQNKVKALDGSRFTLTAVNGAFIAGDKVREITESILGQSTDTSQGNVNDFMTLMQSHMREVVNHPVITKRLERIFALTDIAGYNYMETRYEKDCETYPDRVIVGSETCPPAIASIWPEVEKHSQIIGDFTWTGWDYLGEAGGGIVAYDDEKGGFASDFPAQISYQGDIDITGFRRPASYFREIVFGLRTDPYIAVQNPENYGRVCHKTPWALTDGVGGWTWDGCEGMPVRVEVYAPGDETELLINNKSLGRMPAGAPAGWRALFETVYEPGEICAIAYKDHEEIGRFALQTAGQDRNIVLEPEPCLPGNDDRDVLVYVDIKICDGSGTVASDASWKISARVSGGSLVGFGSGNPKPLYNFNGTCTETFHGRALAIIKKKSPRDTVIVEITGENGIKTECTV